MNDSMHGENVSFDGSEISEKPKNNNDDYALIDAIKNIINSIPYNYLVDEINSKYNEVSEKLFEYNKNNKPLNISENKNGKFTIKKDFDNINLKINKPSAPSALSTNGKKKETKENVTSNKNKEKENINIFNDEKSIKEKEKNKKNEKRKEIFCSTQTCNII